MDENRYISAFGISYAGTLPKISKSDNQLRPIFEAFTNSLEALTLLPDKTEEGEINIKFKFKMDLYSKENNEFDFDEIIIEDNGIGFGEREFIQMENLNDTSKGLFNKGSGRVQFLHFFDKSEYKSIYKDSLSTTGFRQRIFTLSKAIEFLKQNSIIFYKSYDEIVALNPKTILTFKTPLSKKDLNFYKELTIEELKEKIINHYLAYFCENRITLPKIELKYYIDDEIKSELSIKSEDIPEVDNQRDLELFYSKISSDGRSREKTNNKEILKLKAFKIPKEKLKKNSIKLISKGEIARDIRLENLLADDHINNNRFLFLISGNYINGKDSDTRGELSIPTLEEFKKSYGNLNNLFNEEEIILDDIQEDANKHILLMYDEIKKKTEEKLEEIENLKKMFLLDPKTIKEVKINLNDSEEEILEKVYKADAKLVAKKDAEIKKVYDEIKLLNPNSKDFKEKIDKNIEFLTKAIPLQNRTALTHYVAKRKIVLDLFEKIIKPQKPNEIDEALIHNFLFPKGSEEPENSDLWIINEDFIYFNGSSDKPLNKIEINGESILKKEFSIEEEKYLNSLGENRKIKKPDVLLFPDEGKCLIIEFKALGVNASEHLTQIDFYASLIRNYSYDKFKFTTFYGYLIGENIEPKDVLGRVGRYEHSYHFDYLFRPSENVIGFDGKTNGSIYTEVIKYSTLLERAKLRNKIFIEKLTKPVKI